MYGRPHMPGEPVVIGGAGDLIAARRRGLSFRDSILIVAEGQIRIAALFRLSSSMTVIEACVAQGSGVLHIGACRVATEVEGEGRWPTNAVLTHTTGCRREGAAWVCRVTCPVVRLDAQSGELTSGTGAVKRNTSAGYQGNAYGKENRPAGAVMITYGDTGGASRFFPQVGSNEEVEAWLALLTGQPGPMPAVM